MNTKLRDLTVGLLAGILGFALGAFVGIRLTRPEPPDLNNLQNWIQIRQFDGILEPTAGKAMVQVYVIKRLSNGRDPIDIFQTRIEIQTANRTDIFMWPNNKEYAAERCEIEDVDGDKAKEFLLFEGPGRLRILSYSQGNFRFRERLDELISLEFNIGPFDLNHDGQLEFIEDERFPKDLTFTAKTLRVPRVKRWSNHDGFYDVSNDFPQYYLDQVIPALERKLSATTDQEERRLYSDSLSYVRNQFVGTTPSRE